jgi:hypothetical protein
VLLRLINTVADASVPNQVVRIDGPLPVRAVFFAYEGQNSEGEDTSHDDIVGDVVISNTGALHPEDLARLDRAQSLISWCEAYYGRCRSDSATGGAFAHVLPVWMGYPFDKNIEFVGPGDTLEVWVPQFDGTNVDNVMCKVYALFGLGVARYHPVLRDRRIDLGGRRKEYLYRQGVGTLILSSADTTDPNSFVVLREPKERLTWADWQDNLGIWQTFLDIDANPLYADQVIDMVYKGETLEAALGPGSAIELDGGADYLTMMEFGLDWNVGPEGHAAAKFRREYLKDTRARIRAAGAEPGQSSAVVPSPPESVIVPGVEDRPERIPPAAPGGGGGVGVSLPVRRPPRTRVKPPRPKFFVQVK